jgi:hypothetical protein
VPQRLYWWKKKLGFDRALALLDGGLASAAVRPAAMPGRLPAQATRKSTYSRCRASDCATSDTHAGSGP